MSSLSVSCQRISTQEPSLQITMKSTLTQFSNVNFSLKFVVRLESPGPNSQLRCSAGCLQDNSSARSTHREHISCDCHPLFCKVTMHAQAARTRRKHCSNIVVWRHRARARCTDTKKTRLQYCCVLRSLPSNGSTCHNIDPCLLQRVILFNTDCASI
jgi:hypothetical protein